MSKLIDFNALCHEYRIIHIEEGDHHCTEGWVQVHCPFCGDGTHGYHLGYSLEHGTMNCWKCGSHSIVQWLRAILPVSRRGQIKTILEKYGTRQTISRNTKSKKIRKRNVKAPVGCGKLQKAHIRYLKSRNFDHKKLAETWGLMGTNHLSANWRWRIIAPIHDVESRIVAYTGRALAYEIDPRWKTTEEDLMAVEPKSLIYGIEKADPNTGVLVVEGPSDVWRMGPGAVGLLGIDWKVEQAAQLKKFQRRYIMFDPGTTSQRRARELAQWLAPFPGETEVITGIPSDPGDLSDQEAKNIMKELSLL